MTASRKKTSPFLIGIWALNLIGVIGLAGVFLFKWTSSPIPAPPTPASVNAAFTPTPAPIVNQPVATTYWLPTVTPNPRYTPIVVETPTLFVLDIGPKPMVIGYSVLGRPLEVYQFGNGSSERLIVAGIHGGYEWNTIALADELIIHLVKHPESVPPNVTLYILRSLNPDGYARIHDYAGRANENGVDLNHNFPYHWKEEWDRDGCWDYLPTTGGAYPGSEPETVALMNFIELHNFEALISYHSAALGIFAGGMPPFEPSQRLAELIADNSPYAYPPLNSGCDYSGNLTDWASSVKGIPSVDIELTNHRDTDFDINLRVLKVFLSWEP